MQHPLLIPELVEQIASYLSTPNVHKAAQVCQAWRDSFLKIAYRESVYLRSDTTWLPQYGQNVETLKAFAVNDNDLAVISANCPNIKCLTMELINIAPDAVQQLWDRLGAIVELKLLLHGINLSPRVLKPMTRISRLTKLCLSGLHTETSSPSLSQWNSNVLFRVLVACSPTLVHLQLENLKIGEYPLSSAWKKPINSSSGRQVSRINHSTPGSVPIDAKRRRSWWPFASDEGQWSTRTSSDRCSAIAAEQVLPFALPKFPSFTNATKDSKEVAAPSDLSDSDLQELGKCPFSGDKGQGDGDRIVWEKLRVVCLKDVCESTGGQSFFLVPLLRRSPNVETLHLERGEISVTGLQGTCQQLKSFYINDGKRGWRPGRLLHHLLPIFQPSHLKSLSIVGMSCWDVELRANPQLLEGLETLALSWSHSMNEFVINRLLTTHCSRLKKLSIVDLPWAESHPLDPSNWRCRWTLQELEGAFATMSIRWNGPQPAVQDIYGHLLELRRIQIAQHQFRFLYAWMYSITHQELNAEAKLRGSADDALDEASSMSSESSESSEQLSVPNVFKLAQIEVVEVVAEKHEHCIRAKELQRMVQAMPSLEVLVYVGSYCPFTVAAWEWIQRARPDIRVGHKVASIHYKF
ncbi:hypothetical protein BGZ73_007764 [Actinomortierella ambigua]|nr:hypothetical protein BGZ73_007764 [Actinomortierella ambigua]